MVEVANQHGRIIMNARHKATSKAAITATLLAAFTVYPALAASTLHHDEAPQFAQAQQQESGETAPGAPAEQPSAMGRRAMGPGMMAGDEGMMNPEMMMRMRQMHQQMMGGQGMPGGMMGGMGQMGLCPMMMTRTDKDLSPEQVRAILEGKIAWTGNKRLKVGSVEQKDDDSFVAEIVTVDDSLVQRVEVDRNTGMMRPVE